jgi:hypothetical protein
MPRNLEEWKSEVNQDLRLISMYLEDAEREEQGRERNLALARKEARRLTSDIERIGRDVWGIDKERLDAQGPL